MTAPIFKKKKAAILEQIPGITWNEAKSHLKWLKAEDFVNTLYADDDIVEVGIQPDAVARLKQIREMATKQTIKDVLETTIIALL